MSKVETSPLLASIAIAAVLLAPACLAAPDTGPVESPGAAGADLIPIRNARVPVAGMLSGGQPTPEQIEQAARAGFRTVVNIRTPEEESDGYAWEKEAVLRLGMTYVHIPVGGPDSLTRERIGEIDAALDAALERGPVLFHCASGNRIGATLALRAAWLDGVAPADAFAFGRANGMTRLADPVREILGVPAEPN